MVATTEGDERYLGGGVFHEYRAQFRLSRTMQDYVHSTILAHGLRNYNNRKIQPWKLDAGGGPETLVIKLLW